MTYKIIRVDVPSIAYILNFQAKTIPLVKSFASVIQDLNNRPPILAFKKALTDSAKLGMLYAAVLPKNHKEILGFMVGYSPGAAHVSQKLRKTFHLLQDSVRVRYFMLTQALFRPGIDQQEIFVVLLEEILKRARFFGFEQIVFPTQGNEYLEEFISRCTKFDLASTVPVDSKNKILVTVFKSFVQK